MQHSPLEEYRRNDTGHDPVASVAHVLGEGGDEHVSHKLQKMFHQQKHVSVEGELCERWKDAHKD
ncbi:hypothetical protein COU77_00735 [Candidatus Peregrinibacteria bacterium CG10_big_fil_rev_8_21_14_0_10_49_16]|nr:MAG: hypothetical protein COW95_02995 [Candidatus Peregrinibacteria bacterium CG22_combo_CG10-13_8_21_14_all_49_11]PIR52352.1 MAG: hypothetical protein COU77_00735 [Candidatus Peregrinibacteria bacterium CG10_big_fil_rev_8_21_14_0_10_49_16]